MKTLPRFLALAAAFALTLFAFGANAQDAGSGSGEPTLAQIYQAANTGQTARADAMIDQVLKSHPKSAKAHYVKAELSAREHKFDIAKQELATAEKIAPGLPFVKAESVQALRNQLSGAANNANANANSQTQSRRMGAPADDARSYNAAPARAERSFPWGTLIVVGAIVLIGVAVLRRRTARLANDGYGGAYGNAPAAPDGQTGYGPVYPPGGVPPQQPSMGSSMARGLGTGLAVGAGVLAAEEIGRRMFGHEAQAGQLPRDTANTPSLDQIDEGMRHNLNTDMGGDNFGIGDGAGWDDGGGGGFDAGGGGDWDT